MENVLLILWLSDLATALAVLGYIASTILMCALVFCATVDVLDREGTYVLGLRRAILWLSPFVLAAVLVPSASTIRVLSATAATQAVLDPKLTPKSLEALTAVLDKVISDSKK
jgi:hypothetical protein